MSYHVYILRCADGTLYTGYTGNLAQRLKQHQSGAIPRAYTKSRRPVKLVWAGAFETKEEARENEKMIKRWKTAKKETLIKTDQVQTEQLLLELEGKVSKANSVL
jgi:tRNA/rRNA methyltransferase